MFFDKNAVLASHAPVTEYKNKPEDLYTLLTKELNMSLSEWLEQLNPSEIGPDGERVGRFDAFDRHLMANGIILSGMNQVSIAKLQNDAVYLMPELVKREIEKGMDAADRYSISDLVAVTVPVTGASYDPVYIEDQSRDTAAKKKKKSPGYHTSGAQFPKIEIRYREKNLPLRDYGISINGDYKIFRNMGWAQFAVLLNLVGAQMSANKLADIYDLGVTGDGTVGAATNIFNGTDDTLAYKDTVHAWSTFEAPFNLNRWLCDSDSFETMLSLDQFSNARNVNVERFQNEGTAVTPFGGTMKKVDSTPRVTVTAKEMVVMDSRYAVTEAKAQNLMVEAEKIINQKIEETTVSDETVYGVLADGAIKQVEWHS